MLTYTEETWGNEVKVKATDGRYKGFRMEINIPANKKTNERYLKKVKKKIEGKHQKYVCLIEILQQLNLPKVEIKQPNYYFENYHASVRVFLSEHANILFLVEQYIGGSSCISINYEKHVPQTGFWNKTEVESFKPDKNILKTIQSSFNREMKIFNQQEQIVSIVNKEFKDSYGQSLEEYNPSPVYMRQTNEYTHARLIGRYKYEEKELTLLLEKEPTNENHNVVIGFERKHAGFRNLLAFDEWMTIPFVDLEGFEVALRKHIMFLKKKEEKKMNEKNLFQKVFSS